MSTTRYVYIYIYIYTYVPYLLLFLLLFLLYLLFPLPPKGVSTLSFYASTSPSPRKGPSPLLRPPPPFGSRRRSAQPRAKPGGSRRWELGGSPSSASSPMSTVAPALPLLLSPSSISFSVYWDMYVNNHVYTHTPTHIYFYIS